jgi:hypothetical protein
VLLVLLGFTPKNTFAATISGYVFNSCTNQPIANATIYISNNWPGASFNVSTNSSGYWSFHFSNFGDPAGLYFIEVGQPQGASNYHSYTHPGGNQSNMNLFVLPDIYDVEINQTPVSNLNTPWYPLTLCEEEQNCLQIIDNSESVPDGTYCYKVMLFGAAVDNQSSSLLAESNCYSYNEERPNVGTANSCGAGTYGTFDLSALLGSSEVPIIPGKVYHFEVKQFCCSEGCDPEVSYVNTKKIYFRINGIGEVDVDFNFIASLPVDALNNQGDNPSDGLEPTSSVLPGPALGDISIGVDANVLAGSNILESITYTIDEINCNNGGNPITIFEETLPLTTGQQPANYLFLTEFLDPITGLPWFFVDANTLGKCFELTVTVTNECGAVSNSSFFTITETCNFCLIDNQDDSYQSLMSINDASSLDAAKEIESATLTSIDILTIYPNPASQKIMLQVNNHLEGLTDIWIRNSTGQMLQQLQIPNGTTISYNLDKLSNGFYFVEYIDSQGKRKFQKFVKQ